jgi:hypothetical protein
VSLSRGVVGTMGGLAALVAFSVGAVSLTRIAGGFLGFPPGLEWTLTGAVDVAGIAGGVMWTAFTGSVRTNGRLMNISCSVVSGIGVGLDHATHSAPGWEIPAGIIGFLFPLLFSWILHAFSMMLDERPHAGEVTTVRQVREAREVTRAEADREAVSPSLTAVRSPVGLVVSTTPHDRDSDTVRARPSAAASREPVTARQAVTPDPTPPSEPGLPEIPGPLREWMTPALVWAVVASMRDAGHPSPRYGEGSVIRDHRMPDGSEIGPSKARTLIKYIDGHDLIRRSA